MAVFINKVNGEILAEFSLWKYMRTQDSLGRFPGIRIHDNHYRVEGVSDFYYDKGIQRNFYVSFAPNIPIILSM